MSACMYSSRVSDSWEYSMMNLLLGRESDHVAKVSLGREVDHVTKSSVAATEAVRHGSFKVAGMLKMKLHVKKALPERKGWNRFLDEQCTFKARPATKTVRTQPLPKLINMVNKQATKQKADQDDQKATKQKADQDGQQATKQKPDQASKQKAARGGQQLMNKI